MRASFIFCKTCLKLVIHFMLCQLSTETSYLNICLYLHLSVYLLHLRSEIRHIKNIKYILLCLIFHFISFNFEHILEDYITWIKTTFMIQKNSVLMYFQNVWIWTLIFTVKNVKKTFFLWGKIKAAMAMLSFETVLPRSETLYVGYLISI